MAKLRGSAARILEVMTPPSRAVRLSFIFLLTVFILDEARSAEEALEYLARSAAQSHDGSEIDVVVMDIGLPGMDGIRATKEIKSLYAHIHVVMLTVHQLETEVLAALASGADAYCLKSANPNSLPLAIHATALGSVYLDPAIAHMVLHRLEPPDADQAALSPRELFGAAPHRRRHEQQRYCRDLRHQRQHRQNPCARSAAQTLCCRPNPRRCQSFTTRSTLNNVYSEQGLLRRGMLGFGQQLRGRGAN